MEEYEQQLPPPPPPPPPPPNAPTRMNSSKSSITSSPGAGDPGSRPSPGSTSITRKKILRRDSYSDGQQQQQSSLSSSQRMMIQRRNSSNRSMGERRGSSRRGGLGGYLLDGDVSGHSTRRSLDSEMSLGDIDFNSSVNMHKSSSTNFSFDPVKERDEIVNEGSSGGCCGIKSHYIKILLISFLAALAAVASILVCLNVRNFENDEFQTTFEKNANQIGSNFKSNFGQHIQAMENLGIHVTSWSSSSSSSTTSAMNGVWPFVTVPDFDLRGLSTIRMGHSLSTIVLPLVSDIDRLEYENYTQYHYEDFVPQQEEYDVSPYIYRFGENGHPEPEPTSTSSPSPYYYFPGWTMSSPILPAAINFNFASSNGFGPEINVTLQNQNNIIVGRTWEKDRLTGILLPQQQSQNSNNDAVASTTTTTTTTTTNDNLEPLGITYVPIFASLNTDDDGESTNTNNMVGVFTSTISWCSILGTDLQINSYTRSDDNDSIDDYGLIAVLENDCGGGQQFTFMIGQSNDDDDNDAATFLGNGDLHDDIYDDMRITYSLESLLGNGTGYLIPESNLELDNGYCNYRIHVYPSTEFEQSFKTNNRIWYPIAIALIFLVTASVFACYDIIMEHRKQHILQTAVEARMIVASLFPEQVRGRLFEQQRTVKRKVKGMLSSGMKGVKRISKKVSMTGSFHSRGGLGGGGSSSINSSSVDLNIDDPETALNTNNPDNAHAGVARQRPSLVSQSTIRLKSYLSDSKMAIVGGELNSKSSRPIADLFPNTTVMFADIAGFTKWCSQRDPEQVFFLLESIYGLFDKLARKRGVFKVETIGDCYMAVTGLPDAQDDHSWRMAKFTLDCRTKLADRLKDLEVVLGPDTSELCMRTGMHSGPTTAGVLRGDKSRFQLFGDTVNTASRMESTGEPNRIQMSQTTADSLISLGKGDWIRKRQDTVEAKGKGNLVTYWLASRPKEVAPKNDELISHGDMRKLNFAMGGKGISTRMGLCDNLSDSDTDPDGDDDGEFAEEEPALPRLSMVGQSMMRIGEMSTLFEEGSTAGLDDLVDQVSFNGDEMKARQKTIMWQSELLMRCLRLIVARRPASDTIVDVSGLKIEPTPGSVVIDEVAESIELPEFDAQAIRNAEDPNDVTLSRAVIAQVHDYVATIASMYPMENAFHNFEHATHMAMAASKLLSRVVVQDCVDVDEATELHASTDGINSDPLVQFSIVFASLIHDVDHPGVSNSQYAKEDPELASLYRYKSIAESKSLDVAWDVLMEPKYIELRGCIYSNQRELERFRQLLVNCVLATDLFDDDMKGLRTKRWERVFGDRSQEFAFGNLKATIVIEHICQVADIAHCMQHWLVYRKFNERLFIERLDAFLCGRYDKSRGGDPTETWYEDELSFFDEVVIPLAKRLGDCEVFGVAGSECLGYAQGNRDEWAVKGRDIVLEMREEYNKISTVHQQHSQSSNVQWHESEGSITFDTLKD